MNWTERQQTTDIHTKQQQNNKQTQRKHKSQKNLAFHLDPKQHKETFKHDILTGNTSVIGSSLNGARRCYIQFKLQQNMSVNLSKLRPLLFFQMEGQM